MRTRVAFGLVAAFAAAASHASADPAAQRASLSLSREPGAQTCITPRELAERVEARLGRSAFVSAAQADLFIEARIAPHGRTFIATVTAARANGDDVGRRELTTAVGDCRALDADLVLVVALAIDPLADQRPPSPPPLRTIYVPIVVSARPPPWELGAHAASELVGELLPKTVLALDVALTAKPPGVWQLELGAIATTTATAEAAEPRGAGARVRAVLGLLQVCPTLTRRGSLAIEVCAGAALGAWTVRAQGLAAAQDAKPFAANAVARLRARIPLVGPLAAYTDVGGMVAVVRPELSYTQLDPTSLQLIHHTVADQRFAWLLGVGLSVRFH
ncbi:hypothetical protein BH11MYX1_BH11MYX1_28400 [soil metagenome]